MQYFVIQVISKRTPLYWNRRNWGSLENAAFYKTKVIAEKRAREIVIHNLHRNSKTGKNQRISIEEVEISYKISNL